MWSPIVAIIALARLALSLSYLPPPEIVDPLCEIQAFLEPLQRWRTPAGVYQYRLGPNDSSKKFWYKGRTYEFNGFLGMVITEKAYKENHEKITSMCGPMRITEIWSGLSIATSMSQEAPCGANVQLFERIDSNNQLVYYNTEKADPSHLTVSWLWPDSQSVQTFLEPLQRWRTPAGVYQYRLGPNDSSKKFWYKGRTYEFNGFLGMVIPEKVYKDNQAKISSVCGPMEITEIWPEVKIATSTSEEAPCGASHQLFERIDSNRQLVYYNTEKADPSHRTMSWLWPDPQLDRCLEGSALCEIQTFLAHLYYAYDATSGVWTRTAHRVRTPNSVAESPAELLRPTKLPPGLTFVKDNVTYDVKNYLGMVIPVSVYEENKDKIISVCGGPMRIFTFSPSEPSFAVFKEGSPCASDKTWKFYYGVGTYEDDQFELIKMYTPEKASKCPIEKDVPVLPTRPALPVPPTLPTVQITTANPDDIHMSDGSPLCEIQSLLVHVYQWYNSTIGVKMFTAHGLPTPNSVAETPAELLIPRRLPRGFPTVKDNITYEVHSYMGMAMPYEVYEENKEMITKVCGPMKDHEFMNGPKLALFRQRKPCGSDYYLYIDFKKHHLSSYEWRNDDLEDNKFSFMGRMYTLQKASKCPIVDPYLLEGSPLCEIQSFLAPLYHWYDAVTGTTKYTAKTRNPNMVAETPVERLKPAEVPAGIEVAGDGLTYEAQRLLGFVIPESVYENNKDKIEGVCGPMTVHQMKNGPKIALFTEWAKCGGEKQLVIADGSYVERMNKDVTKSDTVIGRVYRLQKASKCPKITIAN